MTVPLLLTASAFLLLVAAWRDVVSRTIPDAVGLLLLAIGGLSRLFEGPSAFATSAGAALLLFALLMVAYSRGFIGGGDVKLMTALAFGLSPLNSYRFVVATAIAGGLLGIAYLVLSRSTRLPRPAVGRSLLRRVMAVEFWRARRRGPLPYGVAIAAGGTFVLLHTGSL
jgi:prepilin peptidase CpaA